MSDRPPQDLSELGSAVVVVPRRRSRGVAFGRVVGVALVAATVGYLAWRGWSFYVLPLDERPDHPEFPLLRPSGGVGQGYGVAATALVFLNLAYLVRRRMASARVGSMRSWLDLHVFTGLLAGAFAAAHSALQARTPIAKTTGLSLAIVIVSGLIGRWIHAVASRTTGGVALLYAAIDPYCPGFTDEVRAAVAALPVPRAPLRISLFGALRLIGPSRRCARDRRRAVRAIADRHLAALEIAPPRRREIDRKMTLVADGLAAEAREGAGNALLRTWRGLHRLFAILMLVTVVVHIGVAWYYGYRWIFST